MLWKWHTINDIRNDAFKCKADLKQTINSMWGSKKYHSAGMMSQYEISCAILILLKHRKTFTVTELCDSKQCIAPLHVYVWLFFPLYLPSKQKHSLSLIFFCHCHFFHASKHWDLFVYFHVDKQKMKYKQSKYHGNKNKILVHARPSITDVVRCWSVMMNSIHKCHFVCTWKWVANVVAF